MRAGIQPQSGIIISGSSGRIGDAVIRRLDGRFTDVVGFDRKAPRRPPPGGGYIPVEITSEESVWDGLRTIRERHGTHVASVIHLAAYYDFFGKPSSKYDEITVQGTGRLLRGLRELNFQVEQFIGGRTEGRPLGWYRENDLEPPADLEKQAGKSEAEAAPLPPKRPAASQIDSAMRRQPSGWRTS